MTTVENEVWISDLTGFVPEKVRNLMILEAKGIDPLDATTTLVKEVGGTTIKESVLIIPLVDIGYPSVDAAEDAILRAMGYETGE